MLVDVGAFSAPKHMLCVGVGRPPVSDHLHGHAYSRT